jgi:hypothetical protein
VNGPGIPACHSHLFKAAAERLLRLEGKRDWELHHVPQGIS